MPFADDLPFTVASIVARCLAKKVEERYATATELRHALRSIEVAPAGDELVTWLFLEEKET